MQPRRHHVRYVMLRYVKLSNAVTSENRLQLGSMSTSVHIDRLTIVDNMSAVANDSRPWVVPQSIKWLSTITRERRIPQDSESGGFPHLFGTFLSAHIGSAWWARHDNNNNNNNVMPIVTHCQGCVTSPVCNERRTKSKIKTAGMHTTSSLYPSLLATCWKQI